MSHGQWWSEVGQWEEYDQRESADEAAAMRQMEADQHQHQIASKWPCVASWPGKEKSPVLNSGNGNGFAPTSEPIKDHIMAKVSEMLPSNYLKQSDFPEDYVVTIRDIDRKNIAMDGKPAEYKWMATFAEFEKPMVLNSTNIQLMAKACGSDDTEGWIGKQVIVYVDENVSFGGELVGGLRIRKHKQAAPVAPSSPQRARPAAPIMEETFDPE